MNHATSNKKYERFWVWGEKIDTTGHFFFNTTTKNLAQKKIEKRMDVLIPEGEVIDDVFTEINGGKVLWDGSVISFSFMIGNDEIESMLYGGMWAENINNEIPLNLDNL